MTTKTQEERALELVAEAICKADGQNSSHIDVYRQMPWWKNYIPHAKAAITAYLSALPPAVRTDGQLHEAFQNYFDNYMQDEADSVMYCVSEEQHLAALAVKEALTRPQVMGEQAHTPDALKPKNKE